MTTADEPIPTYIKEGRLLRLSVAQYLRMIEFGILSKHDRIELLEGYLVLKRAATPMYSGTTTRSVKSMIAVLPDAWQLRPGQPVSLIDSVPEPDIALARGDDTKFRTRHPGPADLVLVVEVADKHVDVERIDMGRIYARANVAVYWIINVPDRQVEVYTDPRPADPIPAYGARTDYRVGDAVPLVLDGQVVAQIPVTDLLG